MELNFIASGIELVGTSIKSISVENDIVDIEKDAKRNFGLNINEPEFVVSGDEFYAQMIIDFVVEIEQPEEQVCRIELSLEGAFVSGQGVDEEVFKQLVIVNGAAAIIGIARGKFEAISSSIFNNGKITIPFVNVVDYYKSLSEAPQ